MKKQIFRDSLTGARSGRPSELIGNGRQFKLSRISKYYDMLSFIIKGLSWNRFLWYAQSLNRRGKIGSWE